ncbi:MAG: hypothetical protein ACK55Z_22005, partial [bacterium]
LFQAIVTASFESPINVIGIIQSCATKYSKEKVEQMPQKIILEAKENFTKCILGKKNMKEAFKHIKNDEEINRLIKASWQDILTEIR